MPATLEKLWTWEDLAAMPDDGVERWIIDGQLREGDMSVRSRSHARVLGWVYRALTRWLDAQPQPRGELYVGDVGVRVSRDPDCVLGADLAYVDARLKAHLDTEDVGVIEGVPTLVVEVYSPSNKIGDMQDKVDAYLKAGTPLVWLVDPHFQTVMVHRRDAKPQVFNADHEIAAEPHLPGFRAKVAEFFA